METIVQLRNSLHTPNIQCLEYLIEEVKRDIWNMKTLKEYGNTTLISLELKLIYGVGNLKECYEEPYALIGHVRFCEGQQ